MLPFEDFEQPERWLPVVGWEGLYEISDLGNVRSHYTGTRSRLRGDLLSPGPNAYGYLTVALYRDGGSKSRLVHQLVLEAFVGPREPGVMSLHGTGGHTDNRLVNLRYGTAKENAADRYRDGTNNHGERCGTSKLTEAIVTECRRRYAAGETQATLAQEYGVNTGAICEAINGKTWAHLVSDGEVRPREWLTGEAHWAAKVTWADVAEIRRRAANGEQQRPLGREFGISQQVVSKIVRRDIWKTPPAA
jgi:hypothetical protein